MTDVELVSAAEGSLSGSRVPEWKDAKLTGARPDIDNLVHILADRCEE